jgi:serine/threonine protein kinase
VHETCEARGRNKARDLQWARTALEGALQDPPAEWDPPLEPHTIFGGYELLEELGRGATGIVYRCRPLGGTQTVAIKLMLGSDFASEAELQRFRFGAETAAELDHPNIVPVLHVDEHEGRPFFTMRLLEGGSLALALRRLRSSQLNAARLIAKVARAVHHAHERGVLHRDLKPENIVLDEHDEPYVADFGLAKRLDHRANDSRSSAIVGSADYMAPEQAAGTSRTLTFAADIYSLGTIFYELLTGELPVQGRSLAEMLERLRSPVAVRPPRELDSGIDRELDLVCLKCLEKDPAQR